MKKLKSSKKIFKIDFYKVYLYAHNNAVGLLSEAEILYKAEKYPRAYFLAFTALEEISKSLLAADVHTGLVSPDKFYNHYTNHHKKIDRVMWAHSDANSYPHNLKWVGPDVDDLEPINPDKPIFQKRQYALYVDIDDQNKEIIKPSEQITKIDANEVIHIVEIALHQIFIMTEYYGHQIGTKGFMK